MLTTGIINLAMKEALTSTFRVRIGAVIFKGSKIISSGHNSERSSSISPLYKRYKNTLHAELAAILNCKDWGKLKGCSILVLKVTKTKKFLSMSLPCEYCMSSLNHVGIKHIFYSNSEGEIVKFKS